MSLAQGHAKGTRSIVRRVYHYVMMHVVPVAWAWLLLAPILTGVAWANARPEAPTSPSSSATDGEATPASQAPPPVLPQQNPLGPKFTAGGRLAIIPIDGMIYDFTLESLKRRVDRALADGASVLVLKLNTKGGIVTSGLDISKYIKSLNVPTLAWIHPEAYSAGIMIASACDAIIMSPASATGDCAPIAPGQELAATERAKILSPILEEFRDSARDNGYDFALFHAMCELGVKVYFIEHIETGERRLVNQVDFEIMVNGRDPASTGWFASVLQLPGGDQPIVSREISTEEDQRQWKPVRVLPSGKPLPGGLFHDGRTLLTVNQDRALDIGLSKATVRDEAELRQLLSPASMTTVSQTWSEDLAGWLTSPWVRGILIVALLLGAYTEFQAPGTGIGGIVALLALVALLGAPFLVGLAEVWHIIVFFLGFILLMLEIFVTPGFGVLGITGIIMMLVGLVLVGIPTGSGGGFGGAMPAPEMMAKLQASALATIVGLFASMVGFYFLTRHFGRVPLLNKLILADAGGSAALDREDADLDAPGVVPGRQTSGVSGDESYGDGQIRPGDEGVVTTGLRPSGRAEIAGRIVDVASLGAWIEPGQRVRVVEVRGNRITVDRA